MRLFAIEVKASFRASHALRLPGGGIEPSHAHTFEVTVKLASEKLDELETVIDFHIIEDALRKLVAPWQDKSLNDLEPFKTRVNPSAERIAEAIGRGLERVIAADAGSAARRLRVIEVRLTEAPNCLAIWSPAGV